jgi:hypothetical protein
MRTLEKLHCVDISAVGLGELKKPSNFYIRQVQVFDKISATQAKVNTINNKYY